jgi:hypothetical protein
VSDYDRWAADYDFWAREMIDDVAWYVELAQEARATGRRVIGIDQLGTVDVAGLEVEALYGGFRHEPFTDESMEFAWVARKPA